MQLTPRYGSQPALVLDTVPGAVGEAAIRQRERLVDALAEFDTDAWRAPSRCAGWSTVDVINHLHSTNTFWTMSIRAALDGAPTMFLTTFDPVATPAALAAADRHLDPAEVLDRFGSSTSDLVEMWRALGESEWERLAEAPAGHVAVDVVTHHALWDAWVHERDVLVPNGVQPPAVDDEMAACMLFAAALGPALALDRKAGRRGRLSVAANDGPINVTVDVADQVVARHAGTIGDLHLEGAAVDLIEILSVRRELPAEWLGHREAWLLDGLREQFDQTSA